MQWATLMRKFVLATAALSILVLARPTPAHACGGCFSPPSQNPTVVTDHRMILSVSLQQTTLYDQIEYSGAPESFAWVLPIAGTVDVGLSADIVFDVLDSLTHTTVFAPPLGCAPPPYCPSGADAGVALEDASAGGVNVLKQEVVGPYETVQLQSTDPQALNTWLTSHGYDVPSDVQPVIDAYVSEGFDFLAMKLVPGASVQSMRPVRVTTQGASPVLPLRMVAAGTGTNVGITLWIVGEGRYEPQNFPFFRIEDSEIVWDYATQSSNYATLRQEHEQTLSGRGWEMESSLSLDVPTVESQVRYGGTYPYYGYDAGADYDPITTADGGTETPDQARDADLATLFAGVSTPNARVTRIRSDIARAALTADLSLQASQDQSVLASNRYPTSSINKPACPKYPSCPTEDAGDNSIHAYGGSGCGVSPESDGNGFLWMFGGVAMMIAHGVLARRRKR